MPCQLVVLAAVLGAACATSHSQTHLDGTVDGTPEAADTVPPDTSGEADTGCAAGLTDCSGTCVDTETDIFNCGGCFEACTAGTRAAPVCEEGLCGIVCDAGWSDMDGDGSCETHCVPTSDTEACNGLDDDCDGVADQTFDCVLGRTVSCETECGSTGSGTCGIDCTLPSAEDCTPPVETCNGSDDDCDDVCDEPGVCCAGTSGPCTTACGSTGTHECTPICVWGACSPPAESCNGSDDDCDDACDEPGVCCAGTSGPCTTGCGSAGTRTCTGECDWGACSPPAESCNGSDDDCDGTPDDVMGCRIPVYRFICGTDHFYHNGMDEPPGCAREGDSPVFFTYATAVSGSAFATTDLFRLYISTPDHFYCTDPSERDYAISLGYVLEGNIGYCSPSAIWGMTAPLFRMVSSSSGDHFYTTSTAERDAATTVGGYVDEGTQCHVWQGP